MLQKGVVMNITKYLMLTLMVGVYFSCSTNDITGTTDETLSRKIADSHGNPVADAQVKLFLAGDTTMVPRHIGFTDSKGEISFLELSKGYYSIMASKNDLVGYEDSVFTQVVNAPVNTIVLSTTGSIKGVLKIQPVDDPRSFYVQALGTDRYTNVLRDGTFVLSDLGAGTYTLRIVSANNEYTPKFIKVEVFSDSQYVIPDSISMHYLGIPVVTSLNATYDYNTGVVNLKCDSVDFYTLKDYVIIRTIPDYSDWSDTIYSENQEIADTVFYNNHSPLPDQYSDTTIFNVNYTVAIRSEAGEIGPFYGKTNVDVVHPDYAKPFTSFNIEGKTGNIFTVDTNQYTYHFDIQARLSKLQYLLAKNITDNSIIFEKLLEPATGTYNGSVALVFENSGVHKIEFDILTEDSMVWHDTLVVLVIDSLSESIVDPDLAGAWDFDLGNGEIVPDLSGNIRPGFITGASWENDDTRGSVLKFDGNSSVLVNSHPDLCSDEFTISIWFKAHDLNEEMDLVSKRDSKIPQIGYTLSLSSHWYSDNQNFYVPTMYTCASNMGGYQIVLQADSSVLPDEWIHVVAVFKQTDFQYIYINGVLNSRNSENMVAPTSGPLVIGEGFKGCIDEVRIYKRALTEEEIFNLYNGS